MNLSSKVGSIVPPQLHAYHQMQQELGDLGSDLLVPFFAFIICLQGKLPCHIVKGAGSI